MTPDLADELVAQVELHGSVAAAARAVDAPVRTVFSWIGRFPALRARIDGARVEYRERERERTAALLSWRHFAAEIERADRERQAETVASPAPPAVDAVFVELDMLRESRVDDG